MCRREKPVVSYRYAQRIKRIERISTDQIFLSGGIHLYPPGIYAYLSGDRGISGQPGNHLDCYFDVAIALSDEAIVALIAHEMHELNNLRILFEENGGVMPAGRLSNLISEGIAGNLHDQAWDVADNLIIEKRKQK